MHNTFEYAYGYQIFAYYTNGKSTSISIFSYGDIIFDIHRQDHLAQLRHDHFTDSLFL
ncbi:10075_t:CDS:2 [Funneliformis geosporum]|uniref:10075_t:CDS:1 n=1 Tax=Funneliformis geosporum TaxID=1117311 RepID=A0A9W4SGJ0_9GLOM|nr:10075_t:CDS:2 [Funneliformis geosporum]